MAGEVTGQVRLVVEPHRRRDLGGPQAAEEQTPCPVDAPAGEVEPGELFVVPRGVEHCPVTHEETDRDPPVGARRNARHR
jgi:hypothetical protein